jgi:hypothetical protein
MSCSMMRSAVPDRAPFSCDVPATDQVAHVPALPPAPAAQFPDFQHGTVVPPTVEVFARWRACEAFSEAIDLPVAACHRLLTGDAPRGNPRRAALVHATSAPTRLEAAVAPTGAASATSASTTDADIDVVRALPIFQFVDSHFADAHASRQEKAFAAARGMGIAGPVSRFRTQMERGALSTGISRDCKTARVYTSVHVASDATFEDIMTDR